MGYAKVNRKISIIFSLYVPNHSGVLQNHIQLFLHDVRHLYLKDSPFGNLLCEDNISVYMVLITLLFLLSIW